MLFCHTAYLSDIAYSLSDAFSMPLVEAKQHLRQALDAHDNNNTREEFYTP